MKDSKIFMQIFMGLVIINFIIIFFTWIALFSTESPESIRSNIDVENFEYKSNFEKRVEGISKKIKPIKKEMEEIKIFSQSSEMRDNFANQSSVSFKLISDDIDKIAKITLKIEEGINKIIEDLAKLDQKLTKVQK